MNLFLLQNHGTTGRQIHLEGVVVGLIAVRASLGQGCVTFTQLQAAESVVYGLVAVQHIHIVPRRGRKAIIREGSGGREIQRKDTVFSFENQDFLFFVRHQKLRALSQKVFLAEKMHHIPVELIEHAIAQIRVV